MIAVQISDRAALGDEELLRRLARAPGDTPPAVVLLRDHHLGARARLGLGRRLREATRAVGARLWVADRLDVACLVEADGVHLGGRSVGIDEARRLLATGSTVSVACHAPVEVVAARAAGADACFLSPILASPGKGPPLGLAALREARAAIGPAPGFLLIALGGLGPEHAAACRDAGADGLAAIRGDVLAARA